MAVCMAPKSWSRPLKHSLELSRIIQGQLTQQLIAGRQRYQLTDTHPGQYICHFLTEAKTYPCHIDIFGQQTLHEKKIGEIDTLDIVEK
ncbi:hypothetical protein BFX80_08550 [Cobetia marina]|nr:hypothetical protein BFX80_08550 [Cobetia marina]